MQKINQTYDQMILEIKLSYSESISLLKKQISSHLEKNWQNRERMIRKFVSKLKEAVKKRKQAQQQLTGESLRLKCQAIISEQNIFKDSLYFSTHLPLILQPESIQPILDAKVDKISIGIYENSTYQKQLASIILNITQEDGLFYLFIKLWISFCEFEIKKIIESYEHNNSLLILKQKGENVNQSSNIKNKDEISQEKNEEIIKFFQKQFFLLCYFIHQLSLYLYKKSFKGFAGFSSHQLFQIIRNSITSVREWSGVLEIFRRHLKCKQQDFSQKQIQENMKQLQKICKISKIPAPFLDSINIMIEFNKAPSVEDKLKSCVHLIQTLKKEMEEYRYLNGMLKEHIFCADDVLSALTFAMWRHRKNLFGSCVYVETILCCEFKVVDEERLADQLNSFGCQARYSFDTVRSVARIGLLEQEKIYSIN